MGSDYDPVFFDEDTPLSLEEERDFQSWFARHKAQGGIPRQDDGDNYDYRGAYKEGSSTQVNPVDGRPHWTDTYKKHNHPTFSVESKYYPKSGNQKYAGTWGGPEGETYQPSPTPYRPVQFRSTPAPSPAPQVQQQQYREPDTSPGIRLPSQDRASSPVAASPEVENRKEQIRKELRKRQITDELARRGVTPQASPRPQSFDPSTPGGMIQHSVAMGEMAQQQDKLRRLDLPRDFYSADKSADPAVAAQPSPLDFDAPDPANRVERLPYMETLRGSGARMAPRPQHLQEPQAETDTATGRIINTMSSLGRPTREALWDANGRGVGAEDVASSALNSAGGIMATPFSVPLAATGLDKPVGEVMDYTVGRVGRVLRKDPLAFVDPGRMSRGIYDSFTREGPDTRPDAPGGKIAEAVFNNVVPILAGEAGFRGVKALREGYHGPSIPDAPLPVDPYAGGQTQPGVLSKPFPGSVNTGRPSGRPSGRVDIEPARSPQMRTPNVNSPEMQMQPSAVERVPLSQGGYASGLPGETLRVRPSMENYERGSTGRPAPQTVPAPRPPRPSIEPIREFNTDRTIPGTPEPQASSRAELQSVGETAPQVIGGDPVPAMSAEMGQVGPKPLPGYITENRGRWFTDDVNKAKGFGPDQSYVDVPESMVPDRGGNEYVIPEQYKGRVRRVMKYMPGPFPGLKRLYRGSRPYEAPTPTSVADPSRTRSTAPLPPDVYYPDARGGVGGTGPGVPGSVRGPTNELPVQQGYTRLYRGELSGPAKYPRQGEVDPKAQSVRGRWFTPDKEYAESYSREGNGPTQKLSYVDVPTADVAQYKAGNTAVGKELQFGLLEPDNLEYLLPDEIVNKSRPVGGPTYAPIGVSSGGRTRIPGGPQPEPVGIGGVPLEPRKPPTVPQVPRSPRPPAQTPPGGRVPLESAGEASTGSEPGKLGAGYAFDRNIDTLKRYGEEGVQLSDKVRTVVDEVRAKNAEFNTSISAAEKGLTSEDITFLRDNGLQLMEKRLAAPNPRIQKMLDWWRGQGKSIGTHVNESGSFINDEITGPRKINVERDNFGPHVYKKEFLEGVGNNDPAALAQVEKMVGPGKQFRTRGEAMEALQHYRDKALKPHNPGTESPRRIFNPPDEIMEQDFFKLVRGHADKAFRSAAEHRQFKYLDEAGKPRNVRVGSGPQGDLGDLLSRISQKMSPADAAAAEAKVMDLLQRNILDRSTISQLQQKAGAGVGAFNAIRFYTNPRSWLKNLTQLPSIYAHAGEVATAQGIAKLTNYTRVRDQGLKAGAFDPYMHYGETAGYLAETGPQQVASAAHKTTNAAMLPFDVFDRQGRMLAVATAEPFAKSLRRDLNSGSPQRIRVAEAKMNAMDLPSVLKERVKSGTMSNEDIGRFTREFVDLTNVRVNRSRRIPAAAASGLDRSLAYQGKNFGIEQTRGFKRIAGDQMKLGNPLPTMRLALGTVAVSYGLLKSFDTLFGPSKRTDITATNILREGGTTGAAGDVLSSLIPDEEGRTHFKRQLDFMSEDQFHSMISDLGGTVDSMVSPPVEGRVPGTPIKLRKSREDILMDTLKKVAPSGQKWERIYNRMFGGDTDVKKEQSDEAKRLYNKSKRPDLEAVR